MDGFIRDSSQKALGFQAENAKEDSNEDCDASTNVLEDSTDDDDDSDNEVENIVGV